jgi:uncharacterized membrane protein YqgA involved in biofilm formation
VIGTILNAAAILFGAAAGLGFKWEPTVASQNSWKIIIGGFAVYAGLSATWQSLPGPFLSGLKSLGIVLLALMLGNFTGSVLKLQKHLNRLGQYAAQRVRATSPTEARLDDTFAACTILFCVSPISVLGALLDGLAGDWKILAAKSAMDGLACLAFARTLGWPVLLTLVPLVAWQGTLTLSARLAAPWLEQHALLSPVLGTAGLVVFAIALVILQIKKVELANYLPSLLYAPLLAWLLG